MKVSVRQRAFTLVEMLVVIAIIGILAAIALPSLSHFKSDTLAAGVRQMLDDVHRARQLAISQRTTVYMVFVPESFWTDARFMSLPASEKAKAAALYDKQRGSYTFVTLRGAGDQPGRGIPRYLANWKSLPEGVIIPDFKYYARANFTLVTDPPPPDVASNTFKVNGFEMNDYRGAPLIPFPSAEAYDPNNPTKDFVPVRYIAFNHLGQLTSQMDEFIPLARGNWGYALDANKIPQPVAPAVRENPPGNSTNAFMLVHIDWLTGRASVEKQEIR